MGSSPGRRSVDRALSSVRVMAEIFELPSHIRRTDRLRVLVVAESFLPQINGVTNSVRRVLEHLEAEGHDGGAGGADRPGDVRRVPGHPRPWREPAVLQGLPDRARDPSPAALGDGALPARTWSTSPHRRRWATRRRRRPRELGIPTVAIYQTDLVGFAERYDIPGGGRAMAALTRKIHTRVDRTLAPSSASLRQLEQLEIPGTALWPRGVDLQAFDPGHRSTSLRRELAPDGRLLVGYVGRLAPEKELELLTHLADDPRYALVMVGGGPEEQRLRTLLPGARFLGVLHGDDLSRAYASLDVFVHTGRHETYCQSAQEALASGVPVVAPRAGGPIDVVADGEAGFLYEPGDGADLAAYVDKLASDPLLRRRMGLAAQAQRRRTVVGVGERPAGRALPRGGRRAGQRCVGWPADAPSTRAAASSSVSTRCTWPSIARPSARLCSSGHDGQGLGPVLLAHQHHRGDRGLVGVVVLAGVLEDLLHGAARAGQEQDAGVADLEQDRLPGGVAEVLRDRRGEHVGRLVAVVPGRDAEGVRRVGRTGRAPRAPAAPRRPPTGGTTAPRRAPPPPRRARRAVAPTASRRGWRPPSSPARHRSRPRAADRAYGRAGPRRRTRARRAAPSARPSRRPGVGRATQSASALSIAWSCSDWASRSSWPGERSDQA